MAGTTMTVRLDSEVEKRLLELSRATARSKSYLAAEAIRTYIEINEWQIQGIEKALAEADKGRLVDHEKVEAWLKSWGTSRVIRPPKK